MNVPRNMRALVAYGPEDYRLETVPVPDVGQDELLVRVEACGICASDLKCYHGASRFWGGKGRQAFVKAPVTVGHEFIGRVVRVGRKTGGRFRVGDRVAPEQIIPCGQCRFCKTGGYHMCLARNIFGFQCNASGGMADYVKFPAKALVHPVPDSMRLERAVLIEPFACAKRAVDRAEPKSGDVVVLAGLGPLGLGMVGCAKLRGPTKLVALDFRTERRALATKFGADLAWNPREVDVVEEIKKLTDGYGCDVYIEATGNRAGVVQGMEMLRSMGTFVEFSVFGEPTLVDWSVIGEQKELNVHGSYLSPHCYPATIEGLHTGQVPSGGVVTHQLPLEDYEEGFGLMEHGEGAIKIVLRPDL